MSRTFTTVRKLPTGDHQVNTMPEKQYGTFFPGTEQHNDEKLKIRKLDKAGVNMMERHPRLSKPVRWLGLHTSLEESTDPWAIKPYQDPRIEPVVIYNNKLGKQEEVFERVSKQRAEKATKIKKGIQKKRELRKKEIHEHFKPGGVHERIAANRYNAAVATRRREARAKMDQKTLPPKKRVIQ
jgi:hypothetical protein